MSEYSYYLSPAGLCWRFPKDVESSGQFLGLSGWRTASNTQVSHFLAKTKWMNIEKPTCGIAATKVAEAAKETKT